MKIQKENWIRKFVIFNKYLYTSVDKELLQYKKQLEDISDLIIKDEKNFENNDFSDEELEQEARRNIDKIANPRIITMPLIIKQLHCKKNSMENFIILYALERIIKIF